MVRVISSLALALASGVSFSAAQSSPAKEHSTGWNSTFSLTRTQITSAKLTTSEVDSINIITRFDRTQLANGGSFGDDFYTLPPLPGHGQPPKAGTVLKVQEYTDPNAFALPPNTALSRILYTTKNLNGTIIPASAFVLWPFQPRTFSRHNKAKETKAPVVLWTHGTSGYFAPGAPSMMRSLWYGDAALYPLVLEGYAIIAPDYAGLGIAKSWNGTDIPHQYLSSTASAYDALYALRAAREVFDDRLTDDFVIMGHSQGGGVAWRTAEVLTSQATTFKDLVSGHLGTVSGSPTTDLYTGAEQLVIPSTALAVKQIFPSFQFSDWLTPLGEARLRLAKEIGGSILVLSQLFFANDGALIKDGVTESWYAKAYGKLSNAGGRPINKPTVILQGTEDPYVAYNVTAETFAITSQKYPQNDLEFHVVEGAEHVSTLYATRRFWLKWIEDRFEGKPTRKGSFKTMTKSWLPQAKYLKAGNSLLLWAGLPEFSYESILGA